MNTARCLLTGFIVLLTALPVIAERADLAQQAKAAAQEVQKQQGIPGLSIALASGGEVIYADAFGLADVENQVKADAQTRFRTASIAKSMTAVAVLQLAEQGKLDLDQPLHEYFKRYPKKRWPITARQLLCHQAGVRHYKDREESYSTRHYRGSRDALETFAKDPLWSKPGEGFSYSSFGYNLLGAVAEDAADTRFETLLAKNVFKPAGMTSTLPDNHYAIIPNRSRGYVRPRWNRRHDAELPDRTARRLRRGKLYNAPLHDTSSKVAGGGLLSTPTDLVRFASALMSGDLLESASLRDAWTEQKTNHGETTKYGLGFRVFESGDLKVVGHSGGQSGVATYLLMCPKKNVAAAVMGNLQRASLQPLCMDLLGLATESPVIATSMTALTDNKGEYEMVIEKLTKFVEEQREQKKLPAVSVSLVDGGKVVMAEGFGPEQKGRAADQDTIYRIGSVSKLFTDIALAQLVAEGKIDLDADIKTYLPNFNPVNPYGKKITLRLLMSHRAGLIREPPVGNYFDNDEPTLEETVASISGTKLVYEPDTKTKYSNAALGVVGLVVQKAAGRPFEEHMQQTMLQPLGMKGSSFFPNPKIKSRQADAWMRTYDRPPFPAEDFVLGTYPAGNMYSSIEELSHLLVAIFNDGRYEDKQVMPADLLKKMLEPTGEGDGKYQFGLGFALATLDGHKTFGHGGAVYGYSTQFLGLPDDKIGVAVACSMDGTNGVMRRISEYAARLMLAAKAGEPLPDPPATSKPLPEGKAAEMAGYYKSGDSAIDLYEYNQKLFMKYGDFTREVRAGKSGLVADDMFGFGPRIKESKAGTLELAKKTWTRQPEAKPADCPERWKGLIGEYGEDHIVLFIYEERGKLRALIEWLYDYELTEVEGQQDVFAFPRVGGLYHGEKLYFTRGEDGRATKVVAAEVEFDRRPVGLKDGEVFQIKPVLPIETLRKNALDATPPHEPETFRDSTLTELTSLDPTIKKDIRYADDTNFLGTPVYRSPSAYMQRPAAEALVRAHQELNKQGYGLLIYDAYRPWFVTKIFWDGTPPEFHIFTANPDSGSKHNRGCAVDLSLYKLDSGEPVGVVAGYDEFSPRSYPMYSGGTNIQRWHRTLLRNAMEAQGFTINPYEWWHFDYKDWRHYGIQNYTFEELKS